MLDSYTLLNILFAFVVGGAWIAVVTIIVDKFGSKLGGFLAGFPSTSVVSFLFIGLVQGTQVASQATTVFPIAIGSTCIFLVCFAYLSRRGFYIALIGSLFVWFLLGGIVILSNLNSFAVALVIFVVMITFAYFMLEKRLNIKSILKREIIYSKSQILSRALFGGTIIAFAVLISKLGGPIYGGIFAAFPALFVSTLIILYRSAGIAASRAVTKTMAVGLINTIFYAAALRYAYPAYGLALGTAISFVVAIIGAYFTYRVIKKMT